MRAAIAAAWVIGCAPPPPPAHLPEPRPTLMSSAAMYNARIVALRTTLGRAAISLVTQGVDHVVETPGCGTPGKGACVRCTLAGDSRVIPGGALEAIAEAFDRYPTGALAAAQIDRVELCRKIDYPGAPDTAGAADYQTHSMLVSLDFFVGPSYDTFGRVTADDIVHHELFHLLEYAVTPEVTIADLGWPVFDYTGTSQGKRAGFVDAYATTSEVEDRASVYQYLMGRPDELCDLAHDDPGVRTKAAIVWSRVAAAAGDDFLRARSPCAEWIEATPTR